ncbi:hypothetical protein BpHYR1_027993 [Brachionus plicatilis]|uniref:Uncharacterized protein n=1 Tax=Brachionus plicatilis TaxID=10195 RepID=A0A3M7SAJ0_BRAPC|nr:hypothetical protein BpHYR1_027993 [Brachionus plicatilis]
MEKIHLNTNSIKLECDKDFGCTEFFFWITDIRLKVGKMDSRRNLQRGKCTMFLSKLFLKSLL